MMLEINQSMNQIGASDQKVITEMQNKLDKVFDINARRVNDMLRLK